MLFIPLQLTQPNAYQVELFLKIPVIYIERMLHDLNVVIQNWLITI
jgi:hypothetical protein